MNTQIVVAQCTASASICGLTYGGNCATQTSKGICHNPTPAGSAAATLPAMLVMVVSIGCLCAYRPNLA